MGKVRAATCRTNLRGTTMTRYIQRLPEVLKQRGRSRSAHYLDIQQGLFTSPVSIGARSVGWPSSEVEAINAARIAGKSSEDIRALVRELEAARKSAAVLR